MTFPILGGNGAVTGVYSIDNSLRFNDDDSAYLSRTPSSAGNQQIWTLSAWIKKSKTGNVFQNLFSQTGGASASQRVYVLFSDDLLVVAQFNGSSLDFNYTSNAKFRDVSAWLNLVISTDTTQATASNRIKIYINGEQITSFSSTTNPSQNLNTYINTTQEIGIGHDTKVASRFFDGYVAETHLIDGTAKAPTDFGEFDEDSGIWKPIEYTGSYGTNGFKLDFSNSGSLGADTSGNGNNFTATNLASTDQTTDTPTNNWCTLNPLDTVSGSTFSEGNLKIATSVAQEGFTRSTFGVASGKWYFECKITTNNQREVVGIVKTDATLTDGTARINYFSRFGTIAKGNTTITTGDTFGNGDIIGTAFDLDTSTVTFYKNGVSQGTVTSIDSSTWSPLFQDGSDSHTGGAIYNFGQDGSFAGTETAQGNADDNGYGDLYYAPPSEHLALCTQNLATELSPTIDDGSQYFNTAIWSGDGTDDRSITGVGFQPDTVWYKERNNAVSHRWVDAVRGIGKELYVDLSNAEYATSNELQAYESDGFQIGSDGSINGSSDTYVGWCWKGSNSTASNTDGSITSTISANTTAGFSIVTYTGTGANATVGHGLGVSPKMVIVKRRSGGTADWYVYHSSIGATKNLRLNKTDASSTDSSIFNNTEPTSSVFSLGSSFSNTSGLDYVAYCFAEIEGYSSINSYTGNGNADGTFVYTGFRPAFILARSYEHAEGWNMIDNKREGFNVNNDWLSANSSGAENDGATYTLIDILSNGFKWRNSAINGNISGRKCLYMAFAENPFVSSNGVPVTAR